MGSLISFFLVVAVGAVMITQFIVPLSKGEDVLPFFKSESGGGEGAQGSGSSVQDLINLMTAQSAKQVGIDITNGFK